MVLRRVLDSSQAEIVMRELYCRTVSEHFFYEITF
jgi:hypothetical protein